MALNGKKIIAINIISLVLLGGAGFGGFYFYDQSANYIKTDNAKIDGQQIVVTAPSTGKLTNWEGTFGKAFNANDQIGQISVPDAQGNTTNVNITVPTDLTVVADKGVDNSLVAPGTPLAYGYDMNKLYVTANIEETKLQNVEVGQDVDIYVDAFKNTTLKGKVEEVGLATASEFSLLPTGNSDANYTKVTQVVPVKISINDTKGDHILPGMNVNVRIHR